MTAGPADLTGVRSARYWCDRERRDGSVLASLLSLLRTVDVVPQGLLIILRLVWRALRVLERRLCAFFRALLRLLRGDGRGGRGERDACCLDPPPEIRARPDPYI